MQSTSSAFQYTRPQGGWGRIVVGISSFEEVTILLYGHSLRFVIECMRKDKNDSQSSPVLLGAPFDVGHRVSHSADNVAVS